MPLHMLLATPASKTSTAGSFLDSFIHEDLPTFALWAALMGVIWIVCAAITVAGAVITVAVVTTIRELAQPRSFSMRGRSEIEDDQLITADTADDAQATIIDLDHYRQRREHHQSADAVDAARGDDPA